MNSARLFVANKLMRLLPPSRCFGWKRSLLSFAGAEISENVRIVSSTEIYSSGTLRLGANTWIGHQCLIVGGEAAISVGANVNIAPRVVLVTGSHKIDFESGMVAGEGYSEPISIADGVWIGAGAIILGGSSIGESAVIAAGAVVKGEVPAKTIYKGLAASS
ncbi:MAG: acyltransferase, partial [Pseudomonadota bacterium]